VVKARSRKGQRPALQNRGQGTQIRLSSLRPGHPSDLAVAVDDVVVYSSAVAAAIAATVEMVASITGRQALARSG